VSDKNINWDILEIATTANKWIESHFKILLGVFVACVVAGSVWSFTESSKAAKQREAFTKLYAITKVYEQKKSDFEKAKEQAEQKEANKKTEESEEPLVQKTGELEKDYPEIAQKLEDFVLQNPGTNAAGEAALTVADLYAEYKMNDKGAEVLKKALAQWKGQDLIFNVMHMRAGDLQAEASQCDKAITHWEVIAKAESFLSRSAQLKMGVCLQKLGRVDEAKSWFSQIKDKDPDSTEGFSASRFLRFLNFKSKTGETLSEDEAQKSKTDSNKKS
jgi:predicted negative regulator of RcsB-dependent stress response